jgi:hypothetical protein
VDNLINLNGLGKCEGISWLLNGEREPMQVATFSCLQHFGRCDIAGALPPPNNTCFWRGKTGRFRYRRIRRLRRPFPAGFWNGAGGEKEAGRAYP